MRISYSVQRRVAAATRPGGPADKLIAMVLFHLPGETVGRSLAISEDMIQAECGGDVRKQYRLIERELQTVLASMTATNSLRPILT